MKLLIAIFLFIALPLFGAVPAYTSFRGAGGITVVSNPPTGTIVIDGSGVVASGTNSSMQVSTNNVAASTMASNINFTAGNNTVLKGTNIGSTAHINYGIASNLSFYAGADELVLGTWGTSFGFSNAAAGGFILLVDDPTLGNDVSFGGTIAAQHAMFYLLGGIGDYLAVDAGGTTFRTNAPSTTDTNIGVGQTLYLDLMGTDATAGRTNLVRTYRTPSNSVAAILSGDRLEVRGGAYPINPKADDAGEAANWNFNAGVAITNKNNFSIVGDKNAVWYMSSWRSNNSKFSAPMMRLENCTNVLIEGMTFIGLRTNAVVLSHGAFVLNNCSEVTFRNCTFSNWQNHAIVFQDDGGTYGINSHLNFIGNTFANIGGTNHVTLQTDGVAIGAGGVNMDVINNHFYNNLRDIEYCCDEDTRKVHIDLNTSEGCYFDSIMITGTNSSEVIVVNNIAKGYANFIVPGATADSSSWLKTYAGSNILVQGNLVSGFANGINSFPTVGTKTVDWRILNNTFVDFSGHAIAMPSVNSAMVGFDAIYERNAVKGNYFLNCTSAAVVINGNNSAVNDNTFIDCNLGGYFHGVVSIGWPTAGVAKNSTNISTVGNSLISSAANAGPAIAIYGMNYSNVVHGNEIDRKFATNIYNLGGGTRTRPVNLVAAGSLLRSDAAGDERAVTIGSGVTFDGTTLSASGGSGTQNIQTNGIPVSDSATGTVYYAGQNIQHFATNASGRVSLLTRTPTNLTFLAPDGDNHILGWFINDAGGGGYGTGTNFGFYDVSSDAPILWTEATDRDMHFGDDLFAPNMDGNGDVVVKAGLGKLQTTNTLSLSNLNVATLFVTNGLPAGGNSGAVQFNEGGVLAGTNDILFNRTNLTLTLQDSVTEVGVTLHQHGLHQVDSAAQPLVFGVGLITNLWSIVPEAAQFGALKPYGSNLISIGTPTAAVSNLWVNQVVIPPNAGAGKVLTSDANGLGSWAAPADSGLASGATNIVAASRNFAVGTNGGVLYLTNTLVSDVLAFGAVGNGTTVDTTAFQNAINSGLAVAVPGNRTYLLGSLNLSNNTKIFGIGGRPVLVFTPGVGSTFLNGVVATNVTLSNLELRGTNLQDYASVASAVSRIGISGSLMNLQGIHINGFDHYAIFVRTNDSATTRIGTVINNCVIKSNWGGILFQDEYANVTDTQITRSQIAANTSVGNTCFTGCRFDENFYGIQLTGILNNGHGSFVGGSLNHNTNAVYATGITIGYLFSGVQIFAGGSLGNIWITNSSGIQFADCLMDPKNILISGTGGTNYFKSCWWWQGSNVTINLAYGGVTGYAYFSPDNYSEQGLLPVIYAPVAITFPASTVLWTNTFRCPIELYIDNNGVTGTAINKCGVQIFQLMGGPATLTLRPGEYFSQTYSAGTPTATFSPF